MYLFDSITVFTESIKKEMISSTQIEEIASCHGSALVSLTSMVLPSSKRVGMIVGDSEAEIASVVTALHEQAKVI